MSDAAMLRPGVILGSYPQRSESRASSLDRLVASLRGGAEKRLASIRPQRRDFVGLVGQEGVELAKLGDGELLMRISMLRRRLFGEGFAEANVISAFALIREIASRRIGLRLYDVQLLGGRIMLDGAVAEMETGEGKTLTATLPACTAALAGVPVHIVTVNDYLVERDARWMGPVYEALGLTVGTIVEGMPPDERRAAYACDVTYCTNKELVFDYLKDRLLLGQESRQLHMKVEGLYRRRPRSDRLLLRGLCFAIVDEADSVFIDEARTPLIIANKGDNSYAATAYRQAIDLANSLETPTHYSLRKSEMRAVLTESGIARVARSASELGGVWSGRQRREELTRLALAALHLYERDRHYLVQGSKIHIVDEFTGRIMADRSWERGLHQMIEIKEGCPLTAQNETLARISYQKFFRRYLRLSGMTGTAREVGAELWSVYRLRVQRVPTNQELRRVSLGDCVFVSAEQKWRAIVRTIKECHGQGMPVLVGTRSVAASELLSRRLRAANLAHEVLNARHHEREAKIIARAGQIGGITVATNMAGRGTDVSLGGGVSERGGLRVIATERHDARRIDRQLFGRCGRQGDPGQFQSIVSIEDELFTNSFGRAAEWLVKRWGQRRSPLPAIIGKPLIWIAQVISEQRNGKVRRNLLQLDENLADMLAFSGRAE